MYKDPLELIAIDSVRKGNNMPCALDFMRHVERCLLLAFVCFPIFIDQILFWSRICQGNGGGLLKARFGLEQGHGEGANEH